MKIADDYAAIAKAQKALEARPEPKVDIMEPLFTSRCLMSTTPCNLGMPCHQECIDRPYELVRRWSTGFWPHDPVVPRCDSGE